MHRIVSFLVLTAALAACAADREPVADPVQPTTSAAPPTTTSTTLPVDPTFADWCDAAIGVRAATDAMDAIDPTDADAVEEALAMMIEQTAAAAPLAPDEIADDVATSQDLLTRLDEALAAADYDFLSADLSAVAGDDAAEVANDRVEAFNVEHCGFVPSDDGADGGDADPTTATDDAPVFDPADGSVRDQTIALLESRGFTAEEAGCLFDNMNLDDPNLANDQEALLALVETCDIDLQRLAGLGG